MKLRNKTGQFISTILLKKCELESCTNLTKKRFSSHKCYSIFRTGKPSHAIWSKESRESLSKQYTGKGNPAYGKPAWSRGKKRPEMQGENHPLYKGGYINRNGYKYISVEGREIGEHHYLIEQKLGRKLTPDEIVHHINHDKLDNRLENLQLLTRSEHVKVHPAWKNL